MADTTLRNTVLECCQSTLKGACINFDGVSPEHINAKCEQLVPRDLPEFAVSKYRFDNPHGMSRIISDYEIEMAKKTAACNYGNSVVHTALNSNEPNLCGQENLLNPATYRLTYAMLNTQPEAGCAPVQVALQLSLVL